MSLHNLIWRQPLLDSFDGHVYSLYTFEPNSGWLVMDLSTASISVQGNSWVIGDDVIGLISAGGGDIAKSHNFTVTSVNELGGVEQIKVNQYRWSFSNSAQADGPWYGNEYYPNHVINYTNSLFPDLNAYEGQFNSEVFSVAGKGAFTLTYKMTRNSLLSFATAATAQANLEMTSIFHLSVAVDMTAGPDFFIDPTGVTGVASWDGGWYDPEKQNYGIALGVINAPGFHTTNRYGPASLTVDGAPAGFVNHTEVYSASGAKSWTDFLTTDFSLLVPRKINPVQPDVTPPYIIRRILTSPIFGMATQALFGFTVTDEKIDEETYNAAVNYCETQGIRIAVTYANQNDLLQTLNDLLSLYGGFLTDNDGVIQFGVVTADETPVRVIDNSHLVSDPGKPPVQVTKAAQEDGYNKVQMNYFDRQLDYKQNQVEASDEVDMDFNGPRIKTFQAQYVMPGSVASTICARALWQNLYGRDQYAFTLGWKDADLKPGALITLVDSFDPVLEGGVRARILKWQENDRGKFKVSAVQDIPYIITASAFFSQVSTIGAGFGSLVAAPEPPIHQTAYELPREFQSQGAQVYFGYEQGMSCMGALLYLSTDGENFIQTQDQQPFIISGIVSNPLEMRHQGYVEDNVEFYCFPTSSFDPNTPTFVQSYLLDDITEALRAQGAGTIIVGSEAIALQDLTLLGVNHYRARRAWRGWGGTNISAHNSGEWFCQHGLGNFQHAISEDDIGTTWAYKIVPYNFVGNGYDISSIDASTYTVRGTYWLPRAMSRVHVFVATPATFDPSTPIMQGASVKVNGGISDVILKWSDSSNTDGFGAGGFGANLYGHFSPDAPEPQYLVTLPGVSSFVVNTGFFNYTVDQNSADHNGFAGSLTFNVQPFNAKGIGPTSVTRSLMMF